MAINIRVHQNAGKFLSGCTFGSFSGRAQLHKPENVYTAYGELEIQVGGSLVKL
jgi:hypothetical protein